MNQAVQVSVDQYSSDNDQSQYSWSDVAVDSNDEIAMSSIVSTTKVNQKFVSEMKLNVVVKVSVEKKEKIKVKVAR